MNILNGLFSHFGQVLALLFCLAALGIGGFIVVMETLRKKDTAMIEAHNGGNREVFEAIESLRKEVAGLRDTTTRYDMSFDTALQRLESRMSHIEQRADRTEQAAGPVEIQAR